MSHDREQRAEDALRRLRKLKGFGPLTPAEADTAYDAAPEEPLSDEEIEGMLAFVLSEGQASWEPNVVATNRGPAHDEERFRLESPAAESWAQSFPLREMRRFRFSLPTGKSDADVLLKYFDVGSPAAWQAKWSAAPVAYRQTHVKNARDEAVAAWVQEVETVARGIQLAAFSESGLRSALDPLRRLTRQPAETILDPLQSICAKAGVAVVLVPELPRTAISGCARWLNGRHGLIGLTLRYKTDDQLWFTFFHELGHLLLHRESLAFVLDNAADNLGDAVVDPQMVQYEAEANRFAADTLLPPPAFEEFVRKNVFSNESIHAFAEQAGVGPGIVVGRLQHDRLLKPFQGNKLKQNLDWNFGPEE